MRTPAILNIKGDCQAFGTNEDFPVVNTYSCGIWNRYGIGKRPIP
jgi:hypothetical protein